MEWPLFLLGIALLARAIHDLLQGGLMVDAMTFVIFSIVSLVFWHYTRQH